MATSSHRLLIHLSILLGLLAISANARPCRHFHPFKTLIFFSTASYSLDQNPNPNFSLQDRFHANRPSLTFFVTEIREIEPRPIRRFPEEILVGRADVEPRKQLLPFGFHSSVDSFRDRSKDVLSAVGALLFGMGCGALTAATMYLVWSLFVPNRFEFRDSDDESDDHDDDDVSAKKMGYVAIPAAADPAPAPPTKVVS